MPKWAVIACFGYDIPIKVFTVQKVKYFLYFAKILLIRIEIHQNKKPLVKKISCNPTVAKIDLSENAKLLVDHEFSQTVGLQKNLPTKTVAFNVY